jgi:hypothetical protein
MTDLLTENARLRAALEAMLHRHILYCGGESMAFAGHTDVALFQEARAALATPAPDAVQEAARVPEIAALIEAAKDLYETAIATKARVTGGIGGQTIECSMRSTMHSVSLFHLDVLNDALRAIAGDRT